MIIIILNKISHSIIIIGIYLINLLIITLNDDDDDDDDDPTDFTSLLLSISFLNIIV